MQYQRLLEIAKALQPSYKDQRHFHVTFILKNNKIMSIGVNNERKTHTRNLYYKYANAALKGTHAELSAIIKLGEENCSGYTFLNIRIDKNGLVKNSKPCSGCQNLLRQVGYKTVYYSISGDSYAIL